VKSFFAQIKNVAQNVFGVFGPLSAPLRVPIFVSSTEKENAL
jgi:hypothetical protein